MTQACPEEKTAICGILFTVSGCLLCSTRDTCNNGHLEIPHSRTHLLKIESRSTSNL